MKSRPILFSAPMVRALLAGTKTQTRRVCKNEIGPNGYSFDRHTGTVFCRNDYLPPSMDVMKVKLCGCDEWMHGPWDEFCPYGQPGDRLWVRETWMAEATATGPHQARFAATDEPFFTGAKWKPSIHMRRGLSRITLEITGVRVERLQGISDSDANAEGVEIDGGYFKDYTRNEFRLSTARGSFHSLWRSINGPGSWDANPWVWVVEFKRATLEKEECA